MGEGINVKKKISCIILIILFVLPLYGCWNNFDLQSIAIVTGIGFDKGDDGKIRVTAEVLLPGQGNPTSGSKGSKDRNSVVCTVEGATFFDAIRNFIAKKGKRLYWNDVQLVVFGENYAKDGITDILDYFQRDQQANLKSDVVITKGLTAKETLEAQPYINKNTSTSIDSALMETVSFGKNVKAALFDIVKQNTELKPCIIVDAVEKDKPQNFSNYSGKSSGSTSSAPQLDLENILVQGGAVLKNYKLVGFLTPTETRGFLFADNRITGTIIVVKNPVDVGKLVSLKVTGSNGKISASVDDSQPKLKIEVSAQGAIGDQQGSGDLTSFKNIDILTAEAENEIKSEIESAVSVSQKEYKCDIFGFNRDLYENHLSEWKKLKSDWDNVYASSKIEIKVKFLIDRFGMINKSLVRK